ncbi:MAG: hypothetical protein R3C19_10690 [Planctomycetaceae bacterium]
MPQQSDPEPGRAGGRIPEEPASLKDEIARLREELAASTIENPRLRTEVETLRRWIAEFEGSAGRYPGNAA